MSASNKTMQNLRTKQPHTVPVVDEDLPATKKARVRAKKVMEQRNGQVNGRDASVTDFWMEELRQLDARSDKERGEAVLSAAMKIHNIASAVVCDFMRWLLDSEAWRSFTYPNGDHYEFREQEFDYFVALLDVDPTINNAAARIVNDGPLQVALAEASLRRNGWNPHDDDKPRGGGFPCDRSKRRSHDEIIATYPRLEPWLEKYGMTWLGGKKLHNSGDIRKKMARGIGATKAQGRLQFHTEGRHQEGLAQNIAGLLLKKGLADDVLKHLRAAQARERRAAKRDTRKVKK